MRALRWLACLAAALLVVAIAAAWLVPPLLDGDRYRGDIALLASEALGQTVRIDGPVSLRLLPAPTLTARTVAMAEGSRGVVVAARELRLLVALRPLLAGRVVARDLVLRGVDARLPWPLGEAALALRAPGWLSALSARIEEGRLSIGETVFDDIQAGLATRDDTGSWALSGTARHGGRPWHFTALLSRPGGDGSATIDLTLDSQGPGPATGLALSGQVAGDGTVAGRANGRGADLSEFLPAPPVPFRGEGRFVMAGGLAFVDELVGEIGGSPIRGAVSVRLAATPRLDVALAASRLDLDAWLPRLLAGGGLVGRLPIGVDLSAEAAQLGGGTLRRLRGGLDFAAGTIRLRDASAILPGDATLRLDGTIDTGPAGVSFDGNARLAAPALRTTLAWVQAQTSLHLTLPPLVLVRGEASAHVAAGGGRLALDRIAGSLDDAPIAGALTLTQGARIGLRGAVRLGRLDLDAWRAADGLGGLDLDLRVEAAQARLGSVDLSGLVLDGAITPGRTLLRRLAGRAEGVDWQVSGAVLEGTRIDDLHLDLRADDATGLAGVLPDLPGLVGLRGAGFWHAPVSATASLAGPLGALSGRFSFDLGDLHLEGQPVLDLSRGRIAGPILLRHPGARRLLASLGAQGLGVWLGEGSLGLVARLAGDAQHIGAEGFELSAGALHATGTLTLAFGAEPRLSGRIATDSLPLPLASAHAGAPLPFGWLEGWQAELRLEAEAMLGTLLQHARATLRLTDGVLLVEDFGAGLAGGQLAGSAKLDDRAVPPAVSLGLTLAEARPAGPVFGLPVDLLGGLVSASTALTASGHSPAGLLASLAGTLRLAASAGTLGGVDLRLVGADLGAAGLRAALAGGAMPFDHLAAEVRFADGVAEVATAEIAAPAGQLRLSGTLDLPRALLDLRLAFRPAVSEAPELGLRFGGRLEAPTRVPELAALIPWRASRGL